MNFGQNAIRICKALILAYLVMLGFMLLASIAIWKLDLSAPFLKGIVIVLYVISSAAGGIYIGKMQMEKKFLWGLLTGSLFFVLLVIVTVLAGDFSGKIGMDFLTAFFICALSGTLGGMLA